MICRNNSNILKHFENFLKKYLLFLRTYSIILKYHTDGQLVKRLRRRPLTAETGVRFPYELLLTRKSEMISGFFVAIDKT